MKLYSKFQNIIMVANLKNHSFKILIFANLVLIISINGFDFYDESPTKEDLCRTIMYKNPNVVNKPDILIIEEVRNNSLRHRAWEAVCRMEKDDSNNEAKYVVQPGIPYYNNYEYDSKNEVLYKGDFNEIEKIFLNKSVQENRYKLAVGFKPDGTGTIGSIALDWVTENLYLCRENKIVIVNVNDTWKSPKIIIYYDEDNSLPTVHVFPNEGYLIVKSNGNVINRYDLDGSNPTVLYNNTESWILAIALDYYEKKIYWTEIDKKTRQTQIRRTNLKGENVETFARIRNMDFYDAKHLQVDDKYVYFVKKNRLFRLVKTDKSMDEDFEVTGNGALPDLTGLLINVLILSGNPQVTAKDHPCQHDNGGCEGYCVAIPDSFGNLSKKCIATGVNDSKPIKHDYRKYYYSVNKK